MKSAIEELLPFFADHELQLDEVHVGCCFSVTVSYNFSLRHQWRVQLLTDFKYQSPKHHMWPIWCCQVVAISFTLAAVLAGFLWREEVYSLILNLPTNNHLLLFYRFMMIIFKVFPSCILYSCALRSEIMTRSPMLIRPRNARYCTSGEPGLLELGLRCNLSHLKWLNKFKIIIYFQYL